MGRINGEIRMRNFIAILVAISILPVTIACWKKKPEVVPEPPPRVPPVIRPMEQDFYK